MEPKGPIYRKGQTGGNENGQNTVTLEKNKEMPAEQVPTVAISLDVSALKIPADQKVFVRHVKENGEVYYYAADTTVEDGIVKTITFVNPDGFSEFTVMANKTVTVTIDGKEYALSAADIGKGFEIAKKDFCDWKGVSFKGIEGVYTTLTKELYDKAANGQKLEGTNVFEQVWFPPEEPTPAPTAAATASTIPQTSDEMPIVPIAIIAIAALLGLGVTAYMKKKQN